MDEKWRDISAGEKLLNYLADIRQKKDQLLNEIEVGIGEMRIARTPAMLITRNLGSCLGIVLYDSVVKIGALIHIKLPGESTVPQTELQVINPLLRLDALTAYAETAIPIVVYEMQQQGASMTRLTAKIAGGSHRKEL
jgi:chemotaxis protein CheD